MIDKLKIVRMDGRSYLCEIEEQENGTTLLKKCCDWEKHNKDTFREWIAKNNLNELSTVKISSSATYIIKDLDNEQKRELDQMWADFTYIESKGVKILINQLFFKECE